MEGSVDRSLVRTVDVVATIADVLDTDVFWSQDGHSAFSAVTRARREIVIPTRDFAKEVRIGVPELASRRARHRRRWAELFGTGVESEVLFGDPWAMAYRIGAHPELLGRRVSALPVGGSGPVRAQVANADLMRDVSAGDPYYPTRVAGPLRGVPPGEHRQLALAVNGRVRAVGRSFDLWRKTREYFSLMVPENALREGRNALELFEVRPGGRLVPLYRTL
jgi:hypothetical protein